MEGEVACVLGRGRQEARGIEKFSVLPAWFCCEPKCVLKNEVY